ncbi:unnamed protein product [Schistocephalus solidus]|uniref:RRM domain-containing protein n=1 Tax=Schistocephalus solidus TaxID=70667 RepID=A0A183S7K0_SCHSO|nr:unnamed protein product [Schistocephalus solidus]
MASDFDESVMYAAEKAESADDAQRVPEPESTVDKVMDGSGDGAPQDDSDDDASVPEHKLKNKRIDPKRAKPSREVIKKIFVGGIDPDLSKDDIMEYFGQFGQASCLFDIHLLKVESLDLPYDAQRGKRKHYIFVSFATEAAAKKAIAKDRQEIYGRQCDVRVAVTREQANKNKGMKYCCGWIDPSYAYSNYAYGDYANAYQGFDPYTYGYYGYDCFGATSPSTASGYGKMLQF